MPAAITMIAAATGTLSVSAVAVATATVMITIAGDPLQRTESSAKPYLRDPHYLLRKKPLRKGLQDRHQEGSSSRVRGVSSLDSVLAHTW